MGLLFAFMPVLAGSRGGTSDQMDVVRLLVRCATSRCKSHFILFHLVSPRLNADGQECDIRHGCTKQPETVLCMGVACDGQRRHATE